MPGVFRPYSLADVLGTMNQQSGDQQGSQDQISGLAEFAESDESTTWSDAMTTTAAVNPTWDGGTWGAVVWA